MVVPATTSSRRSTAQPRFNKPVLSYWIVAGFYHLFGVSVAVERIAIAARRARHHRRGVSDRPRAAVDRDRRLGGAHRRHRAAIRLFLAPHLHRRLHHGVHVAGARVLRPRRALSRAAARYLLPMYVALGLGVLTKGPIAIAIPALVVAVWLAIERRWREFGGCADSGRRDRARDRVAVVRRGLSGERLEVHLEFFFGENVERFPTPSAPDRDLCFYLPLLLADLRRGRRCCSCRSSPRGGAPRPASRRRTPDSASSVALGDRHRRVLLAFGDQGRSLCLSRAAAARR